MPSLDGKRVAVSLSQGGSEEGTAHIYDTATGKELVDVIPRVNGGTAGGSVAWNADGSGFWYTRYPRGSERPKEDLDFYQQIYFHKLGTPTSEDVYVLGKDFPRIAEIQLRTSPDGKHVLALVANGDGGEFAHYLLGPSGKWVQLTHFEDKVTGSRVRSGSGACICCRAAERRAARSCGCRWRRRTSRRRRRSSRKATRPSRAIVATESRLYVVDLVGGPSQVRVFDLHGEPQKPVPVPPVSSVGQVVRLKGDVILFRGETYLEPPAWYRFDPAKRQGDQDGPVPHLAGRLQRLRSGARLRRLQGRHEGADQHPPQKGHQTQRRQPDAPLRLRRLRHQPDAELSAQPKVWLEQGGVYAIANLRGGGEYGEAWHQAGNLTNKQNVFDDFLACARYLIEHKYTSPTKLAIEGGSNGGLLMGAALTQHPELFRAVVCHVGIYDMLRVELHPNGAFNVTEYGTVKDRKQFKALYAYSPYHHVKDGTPYPAVLLLTGENDPRVDPANSRKMAARLQAASSSRLPVLLRVSFDSGHGIGTSLKERIAQETDVYAFLFAQLGMKYRNKMR